MIPLEIVGDSVFETSWWINLPLDEFFLKPITGDFAQSLKKWIEIEETNRRTKRVRVKLNELGIYLARCS